LLSERNYFVFQPLLPEVVGGTINATDAVTSIQELFARSEQQKFQYTPKGSMASRIALNWLFDYVLPRSLVQISIPEDTGLARRHYRAGDKVRMVHQGEYWGESSMKNPQVTQGTLVAALPENNSNEATRAFARLIRLPTHDWLESGT